VTTDRPAHLRPALVVLAFVGGAAGTAVRESLALLFPSPTGSFPATIFVINVVGSFALGFLLETLALAGPETGRRRSVRILLGTGVLGGFTTYSAYSVASAVLVAAHPGVAVVYALVSLVVGVAVAGAGVALAARAGPGRGMRGAGHAVGPGDTGSDS